MHRHLALVGALAATAAADPATAVRALPELATVEHGRVRVVVRSDVAGAGARGRQRELVHLVEQVVADVERRFLATKGTPHAPITLCLMSDAGRYQRLAAELGPVPSDWGFYVPAARVGIANVGVSVGNLRHELVHPLVDDDFPNIPSWFTEGLGSLYGTARWQAGRFEFLVNYRLRDLQRALRAGALPSLAELARSTYADVTGPRAPVYYAYARYLLLYLERRGQLSAFYADMRAAAGNAKAQAALLARYVDEPAFRTWARDLRP